jgi:hypothetical protein
MMGALGVQAIRRLPHRGVVREALITSFGVLVLAGIGLVGQVYHLESDGYQGVFMWLLLILPVTLLAQSRLLGNCWFVGLIVAVGMWVGSARAEEVIKYRIFLACALPYVAVGVGYLIGSRAEFFSSAARIWGYAVILTAFSCAASVAWSYGVGGSVVGKLDAGALSLIPLGAAIFASWAATIRSFDKRRWLTLAILALIWSSCLLILPPLSFDLGRGSQILGCVLFLLPWSAAAAVAAAMERRRLFDAAALVIAIRFIVVYFQVFGSLAATGVGLIVSGALILGSAYVWFRYRGQVARAIREVA